MTKLLFSFLLFCSVFINVTAQSLDFITPEDSTKIELEVDIYALKLEKDMREEGYFEEIYIDFQVDTARIEKRIRLREEFVETSDDIEAVIIHAYREYDQILNKYYKRLVGQLTPVDKELLLEAQRNWIKFKEADLVFSAQMFNKMDYDAGFASALRFLELTKTRAIELFHYLRFVEVN